MSLAHGLSLMAVPAMTMCAAIIALPPALPRTPRGDPAPALPRTLAGPGTGAVKTPSGAGVTYPRLRIGVPLMVVNILCLVGLSMGPFPPVDSLANAAYILAGFVAMFTTVIAVIAFIGGLRARHIQRRANPTNP